MKNKIFQIIFHLLFLIGAYGQNNTFPATGNVGIGTSTPTKKLDVLGVVKMDQLNYPYLQYDFTAAPRTQLGNMSIKLFDDHITYRNGGSAPGNNSYGNLLAIYGRNSHWQSDIYLGADRKMYFRISAYVSNGSENGIGQFNNWRTVLDSHSDVISSGRLVIKGAGNHTIENGNVGIGTTNPTDKLAVNGNIRAKEIKVETANWPDYVFHKNYELKPLKEIKQFIDENGHLPEVPKAKEIEERGLSLGEMNKILMKKVEELTLYIIELEERMGDLEDKKSSYENN
ncbi:hypothetical protein [Sphingobacterium olei]|uniref:hypothetical protein n=1 Tax=Sphingobacterium olei TaxID=2571155 RepID=UPI001EE4BE8C|nr:hypothetical protein [Sphingobacterium olei]